PTQSMSSSCHATFDLASESEKPSFTNSFVFVSNSRETCVSEPPGERWTMQRACAGGRQEAPFQTQDLPSAFASASTSITVSQSGEAVRYEASVVRRQIPRSCVSSFQKL